MYTSSKNTIIKLQEGESEFAIDDGIVTWPRADVEFSDNCPQDCIQIIQQARMRGWLKVVAYVTEQEYAWNQLNQQH
jgi:hypothetical protein